MKIGISLICLIPAILAEDGIQNSQTPIVMWHGMGDTCCIPVNAGIIKLFLLDRIPFMYTNSIMIGNSSIEDIENSYVMHPSMQVDIVCTIIANDDALKSGFNMIGFGQGSLFLRGVIQRCGHTLPPIKNFISVGGPQQGMNGFTRCIAVTDKTCDNIREMLQFAPYHNVVQNSLVQATYWHDPLSEEIYRHRSSFLADINNELFINETYRTNLKKLERFVMVKFEGDSNIQPGASEWFGYFAPGQTKKILSLRESRIYLEDRLGLREMDKTGKLVFLSHPGDRAQFNNEWFTEAIIKNFLID